MGACSLQAELERIAEQKSKSVVRALCSPAGPRVQICVAVPRACSFARVRVRARARAYACEGCAAEAWMRCVANVRSCIAAGARAAVQVPETD
jgi:hypothetical protein